MPRGVPARSALLDAPIALHKHPITPPLSLPATLLLVISVLKHGRLVRCRHSALPTSLSVISPSIHSQFDRAWLAARWHPFRCSTESSFCNSPSPLLHTLLPGTLDSCISFTAASLIGVTALHMHDYLNGRATRFFQCSMSHRPFPFCTRCVLCGPRFPKPV